MWPWGILSTPPVPPLLWCHRGTPAVQVQLLRCHRSTPAVPPQLLRSHLGTPAVPLPLCSTQVCYNILVSCVHCNSQSFKLIFFKFAPRPRNSPIFQAMQFHIGPIEDQVHFILFVRYTSLFSMHLFFKITPNIHWAVIWTPVRCLHPLITYVLPTFFFLLYTLQSRDFKGSLLNSHQISTGPRSGHQFVVFTH